MVLIDSSKRKDFERGILTYVLYDTLSIVIVSDTLYFLVAALNQGFV